MLSAILLKLILVLAGLLINKPFPPQVTVDDNNPTGKVSITPNRSLGWEDFKVVPQVQGKSTINALCLSTCDVEIRKVNTYTDHVTLEVEAIVKHQNEMSQVRESFLAESSDAIKATVLHHENGHFLIAQIIGYRIVKDAQGFKFDKKNYKNQLNQIVRKHFRSWNQMDQLYDLETTKPRNATQQQKWDKFFEKELAKLKSEVNP
ncbi:DUF922 domain-containing protein [Pleomorphovibrio marinus]|uniref:DUF922 domain-containing protein n=1 Tax=Pleomorphovibrio marinus TaxID=2164132 RepID=UPI001E368871|nr:hypothetical protein [Pleomorphovibrio marinus]